MMLRLMITVRLVMLVGDLVVDAGEQLAPQPGVERGLRDDHDQRVLADHSPQRAQPLLGRLRHRDDHVSVLDPRRQGLEPLSLLAREAAERVGVEEDRGPVHIPELPLLGEQLRDVVLGRPATLDDDLAEPSAGLGSDRKSLRELCLVDESTLGEESSERGSS